MIPVSSFLPGAVADVVRRAPLTPEKVAFAWRTVVGAALDQACTVSLEGTLLHVHASSAAWQREVERSAGMIRGRLEPLLGPGVVRGLRVTSPEPERPSSRPRRAKR
ncbi:MAG: DUF721 domain-containing protein [Acidimicrobiia bacterium]|nr:DUF721 domain-containing protein [Acidimicrobiia bacterium]